MAFDNERAGVLAIVDKHSQVPVHFAFAKPVAAHIAHQSRLQGTKPPLVVQRFQDRAEGPQGWNGTQDKISRDFYGGEFQELPPDKQSEVVKLHDAIPAGDSYRQAGMDFGQGHALLLDTYRTEDQGGHTPEMKTALMDFRNAQEKDLDAAAKQAGFYPEYSKATQALKIATAGPHRAGQPIPMNARR